jgi:hypothetical protein
MNLIHVILCLIGAGYAKGRLDHIADTGQKGAEWKNKYKQKDGQLIPSGNHWWYFGLYKPNFQEKFPFSSTVMVFVTDRWHWWQFAMLRYFYLAIAYGVADNFIHQMLLAFVVFPIVLGVTFELVYKCKKK